MPCRVPLLDVLGSAEVPTLDGGRLPPGFELLSALAVGVGQGLPLLREGPAAPDPAGSDPRVERIVGGLAARECRGPGAVRLPQRCGHVGRGKDPRVGQDLPQLVLEFGQLGAMRVSALFRVDRLDPRATVHHRAVEGVEVRLADRVELVVVAAGAGDGHPQERLGDDVDLVLGEADLLVQGVGGAETVQDEAVLGDADRRLVDPEFGVHPRLLEQVAGQVFADQLVHGDVRVQRPDQVVAVTPGVGDRRVAFAAVRLGVADPVHPVPGPTLAEGRIGQEPVDLLRHSGVPVDRGAAFEVGGLCRRRRQAGQHVGQPAHDGPGFGKRRGFELGLGKPGAQETVDRVLRPQPVGDFRRLGVGDRLQAPPLLALFEGRLPGRRLLQRGGGWRFDSRIGCPDLDPAFEVGDYLVGQPGAAQRHPEVETRVAHRPQQQTGARLAGFDRRTAHAALEQTVSIVQAQPALGQFGAVVAGVAVLHQNRTDPLLEELEILRGDDIFRDERGPGRRSASEQYGSQDRRAGAGRNPHLQVHWSVGQFTTAGCPGKQGPPVL